MTTEYRYWLNVVTTSKPHGNALAAVVGSDVGDAQTFDVSGLPCYPAGTTFTEAYDGPFKVWVPSQPAVAWAVGVAVRQAAYDVAAEYASGGYPAALLASGMTEAQIDDEYRDVVKVQAGDRDAMADSLPAFVQSLGYVIP